MSGWRRCSEPAHDVALVDGFDWRDDHGQVAGIEVLPFGLLTFVVGMLLVANAWGVVDAKMATTSAAREAVRAYVEASDADAAVAAADEAAAGGHGRPRP